MMMFYIMLFFFFDMFISLLYLSILVVGICRYLFCFMFYFVLCVFNSFMVYYEEVDLPLYVKGWSGGVLSLKDPLGKVRFLCYGVYLVLHELMYVSIFLMQVISSMNLVL